LGQHKIYSRCAVAAGHNVPPGNVDKVIGGGVSDGAGAFGFAASQAFACASRAALNHSRGCRFGIVTPNPDAAGVAETVFELPLSPAVFTAVTT